MSRSPSRAGFSLIEALVALTIAALVLGAVFELQIQMTRGQQRAAAAIEQTMAQENAIALTRDINPMAQPVGVMTLPGGDTIRWSARPEGAPVSNVGFPMGQGRFLIQMYTVTVEIDRSPRRAPAPLVFQRVGWQRQDGTGIEW